MKALHFGAGNIGRGFIGALLSNSGYEVCFVDVNDEIVQLLNEKKAYKIVLADENKREIIITNVKALNSQFETVAVINAIKEADVITTAVGPHVLKFISSLIASGLRERITKNNKPLNIIACENMIGAGTYLKKHVFEYLTVEEQELIKGHIAFPNCAVDRIVPNQTNEDKLLVSVEQYYEWVIDRSEFVGTIPSLKGVIFAESLLPYIERKLFTVNTGHCITAYLGHMYGYTTIKEAIEDVNVENIVRSALFETGKVLIEKYSFGYEEHATYIEKIIKRFKNPFISDEITRVGRNPIRKLGPDDRLISPLKQYYDLFGSIPKNLLKGVSSGYLYNNPFDEESQQIQKVIKHSGIETAISQFSGLEADHPLINEIMLPLSSI